VLCTALCACRFVRPVLRCAVKGAREGPSFLFTADRHKSITQELVGVPTKALSHASSPLALQRARRMVLGVMYNKRSLYHIASVAAMRS
jgi:hypothetical protein